jgi:LPS sulfotransferase NodH
MNPSLQVNVSAGCIEVFSIASSPFLLVASGWMNRQFAEGSDTVIVVFDNYELEVASEGILFERKDVSDRAIGFLFIFDLEGADIAGELLGRLHCIRQVDGDAVVGTTDRSLDLPLSAHLARLRAFLPREALEKSPVTRRALEAAESHDPQSSDRKRPAEESRIAGPAPKVGPSPATPGAASPNAAPSARAVRAERSERKEIKIPGNKLLRAFSQVSPRADAAALPLKDTPTPTNNYVILITPRSGSTFLTHALAQTNVLGNPNEWFNHDSVLLIAKEHGLTDIDKYSNFIIRQKKSANGVFGVELSWPQFNFLNQIASLSDYLGPEIVWFSLRRRNLVGQAISLMIANQTGIFHSYQTDGKPSRPGPTPIYDATALRAASIMLVQQELAIQDHFRKISVKPIELFHEDIVGDEIGVIRLFSNALRVPLPAGWKPRQNPIRPVTTPANAEFEQRFRSEEREFLEALKKRRPPIMRPDAVV